LQLTLIGRTDVSEEQYFDVLRRKTAHLFSACCEIGAILGGGTPEEQEALRDYGLNLGTAFQLVDDLLDFTSTDGALGKPAGFDLLEGKVTLPLIHLLEAEPRLRPAVQQVMRDGSYRGHPRQTFLRAAEKTGSLARARERADRYADAAASALAALRPSAYADALRAIPSYILEREA